MDDKNILSVLNEILTWTRASSYEIVKKRLEAALPDSKSRMAYQMLDGTKTVEQIRVACKMSPNSLVALSQRCTSIGLMRMNEDKKRIRLFDLADFDLLEVTEGPKE